MPQQILSCTLVQFVTVAVSEAQLTSVLTFTVTYVSYVSY